MNRIIRINNEALPSTAKQFAYDGCHLIKIIETRKDLKDAKEGGWDILPLSKLERTFERSCCCRSVSNWNDSHTYVAQNEEMRFEIDEEQTK